MATKRTKKAPTAVTGTLYLRTVDKNRRAYGGFQWPSEVGSVVEAPDYRGTETCDSGLHGLPWGQGSLGLLSNAADAVWQVVGNVTDPVDIDGSKSKFRSCVLLYDGDREGAIAFMAASSPPGGIGLPWGTATAGYRGTATAGGRGTATAGDWGTATAGDRGTATAGDGGTATAGDRGTATAGDWGTATAGDGGTAIAGYRGTATAGDWGTATAGDRGTATAGDGGTATAGDWGTATAGDGGTATAGDRGTATAGYRGTAIAGYRGTATAGDWGTATAGDWGTATAGDGGTATAGDWGTATAGDRGTVCLRWWDGDANRYRTAVGYVGEDGIVAGKRYRVEGRGKLVEAA